MTLPSLLIDEIANRAVDRKLPDGSPYRSLSLMDSLQLARRYDLMGWEVEIGALENGVVPERYARNLHMMSPEDQVQLLQSRVSVIGLGGLGGAVTEILARIGIGRLSLFDADHFEDSNLNRQFLSNLDEVGSPKAEAAAARVGRINPSVEVHAAKVLVGRENAEALLRNSDGIVDCLDNIQTRFVIEDAARRLGCPLVSAAVAGASGHLTTVFPSDPGLVSVFGPRDAAAEKGSEASLGCLPQAVTFLATLECSEIIKILLGRGALLRGKLLTADLMDNTFEILRLQ
ncbi:hypothetical protein D3OALGA1CA_2127 [Olavius algarvensis associated proteobacterium Delta 3]|nr:hypothetical protein D3OALGB2SA_676 [Olavius algarvensis associated proteobacterium Delta 3]CAB5112793.1 hypothetical protein D3OALGA1CA_2127 [Olavius algarvensis associated proteobacterium Delta 3]